MGEENWDPKVPRSKGTLVLGECCLEVKRNSGGVAGYVKGPRPLGSVLKTDGPRVIVCADCGTPVNDGLVFHIKPETYAIEYGLETFYIERHIGISCGCARKRRLRIAELPPSADALYDAMRRESLLRGRMEDALIEIVVGTQPPRDHSHEETPEEKVAFDAWMAKWPFHGITFDDYDGSFEFKKATPGWRPSTEMLTKFWALGFVQFWVCYTDGTEAHFMEPGAEERERKLNEEFMAKYRASFKKGVVSDGVPAPENYRAFAEKWGYPDGWTQQFVDEVKAERGERKDGGAS